MKIIPDVEQTLLELLVKNYPDCSKSTLRSWLEQGRVSSRGRPIRKGSFLVRPLQEILIGARSKFLDEDVQILFQDSHLIVINKPEGLLSVDTDQQKRDSLHAILKEHFHPQRIYPVHRLDRETSGVIVFALSEQARDGFRQLFMSHTIEREYVAVIEGHLAEKRGTWKSYLKEDHCYFVHTVESEKEGELAITHYEQLTQNKRYTALRLRLETGKKNQVRVHASEAGCPIVGDKKYGANSNPIHRVCLHARKLGFVHPVTQKKYSFEVPIPESFFKIVHITH